MNEQVIQEITDEVKRDQMIAMWKQYQGWIISAVLAVLIGVGGQQGYQAYQHAQAEKSSVAFVAASKLEDEQKLDDAAKAFEDTMKHGTPGFGAIAGFRLAAIYGEQGKTEAQLATLKAIADETRFDQAQRELALLTWAYNLLAQGKQSEAEAPVKTALKDSLYPGLFKEWQAMAALKQNDSDTAKILLNEIATDADAPESLKMRAKGILAVVETGTSKPATAAAPAEASHE
ncbi:tetratricopeptide repeat protein [bacterium]|nr:tetratricopeptide repeat protein [bacterium]